MTNYLFTNLRTSQWTWIQIEFKLNSYYIKCSLVFSTSAIYWLWGLVPFDPTRANDPSGSVRICGVPASWATIQQRSSIFRTVFKDTLFIKTLNKVYKKRQKLDFKVKFFNLTQNCEIGTKIFNGKQNLTQKASIERKIFYSTQNFRFDAKNFVLTRKFLVRPKIFSSVQNFLV